MESNSRNRFCLTRRYRISRREGFSRLLQQKPKSNRWFAIHSIPNNSGCARLGLSVGKRFVPLAVQRNRVKRKIRECFRLQDRTGKQRDVVIRLKGPVTEADESVAFASLAEQLKKLLANR